MPKQREERDRKRYGKRRRYDREENETEGMRWETIRQGDRDRVGEGGSGMVRRVGRGNRQPVYYQGSIKKHLGTNRTPPPCHPEPFSRCQSSPFSQTPGGRGSGGGGQRGGSRIRVVRGQRWSTPVPPPSWCIRCCTLATALRVWPQVIWLHSVSHMFKIHTHTDTFRGQNCFTCTTISTDHAPTQLHQHGRSRKPHRELS